MFCVVIVVHDKKFEKHCSRLSRVAVYYTTNAVMELIYDDGISLVLSNLILRKNLHYFSGPSVNVHYDVDY